MSGLRVQVFSNFESLADLTQEWNTLVRAEGLGPSEEFEWMSTLWRLHSANRQLFVALFRDDEGITGIAPLVVDHERRRGVRAKIVRMLGYFYANHGTPLILGRRKEETLSTFFDYLREEHGDWTLWFTGYVHGSEQERSYRDELASRGLIAVTSSKDRSPYLLLSDTWEEKMKALQPRFRTALRSREKRLREKGTFELRFMDSPAEWEAGLEAIREIEQDSWKVEAGTAITVQDFQWEFYRQYAPIAAAAGTLRIPILLLNGEPIAYDCALYQDCVYYLMKTSYKNSWKEMYPGFVLRKLLVEWAYERKCREIDFLGKDEDWKMKWTSTVREHTLFTAYNRTWAGRYLHGLNRVRALLHRWFGAFVQT